VVANPPDVESGAVDGLMPEVARFEPRQALDGGVDGLDAYRAIAGAGAKLIAPRGHLVVEIGEGQAIEIASIFDRSGLRSAGRWRDLGGVERVLAVEQ
jgi:release factor glutamine methyltransferase